MSANHDVEDRLANLRREAENARVERARAEERETALKERLREARDRMVELGAANLSEAEELVTALRRDASEALDRAEAAMKETK